MLRMHWPRVLALFLALGLFTVLTIPGDLVLCMAPCGHFSLEFAHQDRSCQHAADETGHDDHASGIHAQAETCVDIPFMAMAIAGTAGGRLQELPCKRMLHGHVALHNMVPCDRGQRPDLVVTNGSPGAIQAALKTQILLI